MGFTNSGLVTYKNLTKNKTTGRKGKKIDTITIHCLVGQATAKEGCDYFATTKKQRSSNYVVGHDGSIGLSVEEKNRSWCSGGEYKDLAETGSQNDYHAVTIEVACEPKHPYEVTPAAYDALIKLVADIAKRNKMGELKWKNDKTLVGQPDKQNMTIHAWFANKSCPGKYLRDRMGDIADKANKMNSTSAGSMTDKEMFEFFKANGLTDAGAAGLMGNLLAESAMKSTNLQNTFEKKLKMSDEEYTKAVDAGEYDNFIKDGAGYGLAQWTYWTRKRNLLNFMKRNGVSIGNKRKQVDFLLKELKGYKNVYKTLTTTNDVKKASDVVLIEYESPANMGESVKNTRYNYSQRFYDKYATKTPNATFKEGDLVKIKSSATHYYNSNKKIPYWVKKQKWFVKSIGPAGDRVVIDKNEAGTNSIRSPFNASDLIKI